MILEEAPPLVEVGASFILRFPSSFIDHLSS